MQSENVQIPILITENGDKIGVAVKNDDVSDIVYFLVEKGNLRSKKGAFISFVSADASDKLQLGERWNLINGPILERIYEDLFKTTVFKFVNAQIKPVQTLPVLTLFGDYKTQHNLDSDVVNKPIEMLIDLYKMLKKELIDFMYFNKEDFWKRFRLFLIVRQYLLTIHSITKYAVYMQNKLCNQLISQYDVDPKRISKYRYILTDNEISDYLSELDEETDQYEVELIERIKETYVRLKNAFLPPQ